MGNFCGNQSVFTAVLSWLFLQQDQFLRRCGVDGDGAVEIGLGGARDQGDGEALRDFRRVLPDHVEAQNLIRFAVDDELDQRAFVALRQRVLHAQEIIAVDVDFSGEFFLRPFLRESDLPDGWI